MVCKIKQRRRRISSAAAVIAAVLLLVKALPVQAAEMEVSVRLEFDREITGAEGQEAEFSYELTAENMKNPMPAQSGLTLAGAGEAAFKITFAKTGVYRYTISQAAGNSGGWDYDTAIYQTEVWVTRTEDGALTAAVLYYNEAGEKTTAVFHNSYKPLTPVKPPGPQNPVIPAGLPQTGELLGAGIFLTALGVSGAGILALLWGRKIYVMTKAAAKEIVSKG